MLSMKKTVGIFKTLLCLSALVLFLLNLTTSYVKNADIYVFNQIDQGAEQYIDASLKKSLLSFGVTKAMNAAISFLQETTIAIQPLGVGVELAVGQVLDPLNDMVERSSWVFLASATSLGVQSIFLKINRWVVTSVLLNAFLVCSILSFFIKTLVVDIRNTAFKLGLLILFVRCFIPFSYLVSSHLYETFMQETYAAQIGILDDQKNKMDTLSGVMRETGHSREQISAFFNEVAQIAKDAGDRLIKLITIFITQVIVLPLAFLWLFLQGLKFIVTMKTGFKYEYLVFDRIKRKSPMV